VIRLKSEKEVRGALESHKTNMQKCESVPSFLKEIAKDLGWSRQYTKGYMEGVKWAYEWMLGQKP
jgi:hypothetical protein